MERRNRKTTTPKSPAAAGTRRFALCALVLVLSAVAFYCLFLRVMSQTHLYQAKGHFQEGYYGLCARSLQMACDYQPGDHNIHKELGKVYLKLGNLRRTARESLNWVGKARAHYHKACELNPLDAEAAYGLARGENRLKNLFQYLYPEKGQNPHEPLPYYKEAISLRPNGILFRYAMARYLHSQGMRDELLLAVHALARIYPPTYAYLKREPFWSPDVRETYKTGLRAAIRENVSKREAHMALSSMLAGDKEWEDAIFHYEEALRCRAFDNREGNYIHLGSLHLKNRNPEAAERSFFKALEKSVSRESALGRLYSIYKNAGYPEELTEFYQKAMSRYSLSGEAEILLVRSLIDQTRYNQARRILTELNDKSPDAGAYYWLARIARAEKDWDAMELAIQKATVLEPRNSHYHQIFSNVLRRLKKLERAEKEAGLVIKYKADSSPGPYDYRAWIRWGLKDYQGAVDDWKTAVRLSPRTASYYARAAEAHLKLGQWSQAMACYKQAVALDPKNERYQKKYSRLKDAD